jgi:hypothetical protein
MLNRFRIRPIRTLKRNDQYFREMNVNIVGSRYVGKTIAACITDTDHGVTNVDIDEDIVAAINERGPDSRAGTGWSRGGVRC